MPKLDNCSAETLIAKESPRAVELPWRHTEVPAANLERASGPDVEPHVTSVPVAAVVGGLMMASMGITQRLRRIRGLQN